jgi:hypothetical protein
MTEMAVTIQAHAFGGHNGVITRVVLHDEEFPVEVDSAIDVANYFASTVPGTSAHYVVDADDTEHCVAEDVVAYHARRTKAPSGLNTTGTHGSTPQTGPPLAQRAHFTALLNSSPTSANATTSPSSSSRWPTCSPGIRDHDARKRHRRLARVHPHRPGERLSR